jgi:hypothetical protein
VTTIRRLTALTIMLVVSVAVPIAPSVIGASTTSIVAYSHLGLVDPVAICAHGKYVWIADLGANESQHGQVVRVTASTGAHLSITSPLINHPSALISDGSYVWVVNGSHFSPSHPFISRIDIATNKVTLVRKLSSPGFLDSLAIAGRYLWVSGVAYPALLRINRTTLSTTKVTSDLFVGDETLAADRHYLWVASDAGGLLGRGSLVRLSLTTGDVKAVNSPFFNDAVTVTSNGTSVWMPASNHVVVKVDIATGKVIKVSSRSFSLSLWIASTKRDVYVMSVQDDLLAGPGGALTQINAATDSLRVITSKFLTSPKGLAVLGSHVWVISSSTLASGPTGPTENYALVRITP